MLEDWGFTGFQMTPEGIQGVSTKVKVTSLHLISTLIITPAVNAMLQSIEQSTSNPFATSTNPLGRSTTFTFPQQSADGNYPTDICIHVYCMTVVLIL